MPVINVKMTHEDGGATVEQKEELVKGINPDYAIGKFQSKQTYYKI